MKPIQQLIVILALFLFIKCTEKQETKINRKNLVTRHNVINVRVNTLSSLSVGNGKFAFTADVTGLQTFPEVYANGVPLGTQSEWGWHSFLDTANFSFQETLKEYDINGRKIPYPVQFKEEGRSKDASNYFRQNPHRLHLANLGFDIFKKDGSRIRIEDVKEIKQELNLWTGELKSNFEIENEPVEVSTFAHQDLDAVAVKVKSNLIKTGQLKVRIRFPYPNGEWKDGGNNWSNPAKHGTKIIENNGNKGIILHQLDSTEYFTSLAWKGEGTVIENDTAHYFTLSPSKAADTFEFTTHFAPKKYSEPLPDFAATEKNNTGSWQKFWETGGAVDFNECTDPRAKELERRVVLSQYLTKIQCTGDMPPQETGLTYNSWYGRPHLEMHWWHGVHFPLWNRTEMVEKSLDWYKKVLPEAKRIAERQGFKGVRWQKMTDPEGKEAPSSVGSFLIWQQPHVIYLAELIYQQNKKKETLNNYKELVYATADFMASYPHYEQQNGRYILGKGLIPAQQCFDPEETFNPTYELAYWHWALSTAQKWRERDGLKPDPQWNDVMNKLSPLPQKDGVYLASESVPDCYTSERYRKDHPAVLGAFGMLPASNGLDTAVMDRTFDLVWKSWFWNDTWGWDFPMTAMTATRLGKPEKAIEALLMDVQKNTYLPNGHNYQDERLTIYLPGNGGLLTAIAMMCAGWEGSDAENPGFPKDGKWNVKWEGLNKMP